MNHKRDNFSKKVIEKSRSRVGSRCSNPDCRVPTTGPTSDPNAVNNVGIAAHICAASLGGARYDASMTKKERASIQNAIWLCSICATKIDRDPVLYSRELLSEWKKKAEDAACLEIGKKLPNQQDIVNTLSSALTGLPTTFLPEAIRNTCEATTKVLEKLDQRFMVTSSYQNNRTQFSISAKENVACQLLIKEEFKREFLEKYENLVAHGDPLEIDGRAIRIQGSALIESIIQDTRNGKFVLLPGSKKAAVLKVWLTHKEKKETFVLNDLVGEISTGNESFSFKGSVFEGILEFISRQDLSGLKSSAPSKVVFKMNLNLQKWEKTPIDQLPYFEKIYEYFENLKEGWNIHCKLEIDGRDIFSGFSAETDSPADVRKPYPLFRFIFLARAILKHFGKTALFSTTFEYSRDTHERLYEIHRIISGEYVSKFDPLENNATCTLIADDGLTNVDHLIHSREPYSVKFEQDQADSIMIFGETINLPRYCHILTKVRPKISQDMKSIRPGDEIIIEWIPEEGCEYKREYVGE